MSALLQVFLHNLVHCRSTCHVRGGRCLLHDGIRRLRRRRRRRRTNSRGGPWRRSRDPQMTPCPSSREHMLATRHHTCGSCKQRHIQPPLAVDRQSTTVSGSHVSMYIAPGGKDCLPVVTELPAACCGRQRAAEAHQGGGRAPGGGHQHQPRPAGAGQCDQGAGRARGARALPQHQAHAHAAGAVPARPASTAVSSSRPAYTRWPDVPTPSFCRMTELFMHR